MVAQKGMHAVDFPGFGEDKRTRPPPYPGAGGGTEPELGDAVTSILKDAPPALFLL